MKLILTVLLFSGIALGQINNYYVSPLGNDANTAASVLNSGGATAWKTIQHGIGAVTLGAGGTILHVAAGNYSTTNSTCGITSNVCVNFDGTSSARFVVQCDDPVTACKLTGAPVGGYAAIIKANYADFTGFEVGPCSGCNAGIAILGGTTFSNKGTNIHVLNNYVHDIAQTGNDGNGFGNGCPSSGMIIADFKGQSIPGLQILGNRINNGGLMSLTSCNQFHGLYVNGATLIQNNLISNIVGEGINFGPSPCGGAITGNTVIHNGQRGILIASYSGDNCSPDGHMTVNMNIADNNGVNNSGVGCGIGESGAIGTTNLYSGNLLQGNTNGDNICLQTNPPGSVVNLKHEATSLTFVAYNDNGLGDYHIKSTSVANAGGTTACASGGFPSPCSPSNDFANLVRPNPPAIGAFEVAGATAISHLAPAPSSFPSANVGSCSAPQFITVSNPGTAALTITPDSTVTGANLADFPFAGTGTCSTGQVLNPTQSCLISLKFCPSLPSLETAQLNVFTTAPNGTQTSALSGTGTQPDGSIAASTGGGTLAFGNQALNTVSGVLQGVLTSAGTGPLTITAISVSSPYVLFSDTCPRSPATMTPGQTCQINVKFGPLVSGSQPGTLTVSDNAISGNQTLSLTGTGQSPSGTGAVILGPVLITGGVVFNPQ